ncbi:PAN domain-containing protein [Purpureocillium lavendulum]|uniref:PAN domain-containing protein n=1 Tax=Purpureocillium lavendulum TaxID=1247861 RepID=A0AB34FQM0_9HYPO|nr:PAN domain-containing protein [Purpureocillium lavendulum]
MQFRNLVYLVAQAAAAALPDPDPAHVQGTIPEVRQHHKPRAACNNDNVLRAMRDKRFSSSASDFCSTYIRPTVTQTAYASTEHQTVTATPTETVFDVSTRTVVNTMGIHTTYIYSTIDDPRYNWKRDAPAYPTWLGQTYEPSRVSSACSCLITSPAAPAQQTVSVTDPVTVTDTDFLPTATVTVHTTTKKNIYTVPTVTATLGIECGLRGCTYDSYVLRSTNEKAFSDCVYQCGYWGNCVSIQWNAIDSFCNLLTDNATVVYNPETANNLDYCRNYQIYDWQCVMDKGIDT